MKASKLTLDSTHTEEPMEVGITIEPGTFTPTRVNKAGTASHAVLSPQVSVETGDRQQVPTFSLKAFKVEKEKGQLKLFVLSPDQTVELDYQGTPSPGKASSPSQAE